METYPKNNHFPANTHSLKLNKSLYVVVKHELFKLFVFLIMILLPWLRFTLAQMILWKHNCTCIKGNTITSSFCLPFLFQEQQELPVY